MRTLAFLTALGLLIFSNIALAEPEDGSRVEAGILQQWDALKGRRYFSIEPGLQFTHITSNRLDISGYTIPTQENLGINIGKFEVEKVRKEILAPSMTLRFGVADVFQADLRIPYIMREDEIAKGAGENRIVQIIRGDDIGDIEGGILFNVLKESSQRPGLAAGLKVKSRTGRSSYGIPQVPVPFPNEGSTFVPTDLPTGSGHWGFTPYLTLVKTSEPAVLFATLSYFYHLERDVDWYIPARGETVRVKVDPSNYIGYSIGMAYALNEKLAISTAFDQKFYSKAKVNGVRSVETDLILGSLVFGGTYAVSDRVSVNLSLGIGLTPDSPDMEVSVRVPFRFSF